MNGQSRTHPIDNAFPFIVDSESLGYTPIGGDTIWISPERTNALKFINLNGSSNRPIVVINAGGQVVISNSSWAALNFQDCKHIKVSGRGDSNSDFGFALFGKECGLAFTELSSGCEAENIYIKDSGFFGIYAKKDYGGNPPSPVPVFDGLKIHHCFIENVTEGMYLGETKTPGMEFINVEIYDNVVRNTGREAIQIANMVENVAIHHNTLINTGEDQISGQHNVLQIGDNSVSNVFNNVLLNAPGWGIIAFGSGDNKFENNYLADNKGIFIDNRKVTDIEDSIVIERNYFRDISADYIVKSYNELNFHRLANNYYTTAIPFFNTKSHNNSNYELEYNDQGVFKELEFVDSLNTNYSLTPHSYAFFDTLGARMGELQLPVRYQDEQIKAAKIWLDGSMLVDEVEDGSVFPAVLLVDEQGVSSEKNEHPESRSWKPAYTMKAPAYHVYIDLHHKYFLTELALHDMHNVANLEISVGEPGDWTIITTESCNAYNTWKTHQLNVASQYLRFSMTESVYASVNEINLFGYPYEAQIVLDSSMIVDEVTNGSYLSANVLVDEQALSPNRNEHPESESWKPYWNMNNGPYSVYFDLGHYYNLTRLYIHDMHGVGKLEVQIGEPGAWETLFYEPCNGFKTWKEHYSSASTRYVRLVMAETLAASVNELLLYGTPDTSESILKSQDKTTNVVDFNGNVSNIILYPNPVKREARLMLPEPYAPACNISVYTINGKLVYRKNIDVEEMIETDLVFDFLETGRYILKYMDELGRVQAIPFDKIPEF